MTTKVDKTQWIEFIVLLSAFIGMLAAIVGPLIILSSQVGFQGSSIWPLPALVLIDWILIGILGFFGAYLGIKTSQTKWLKMVWLVLGMLLALIVIGALSIGSFVLISLIFFFASTFLITLRKGMKWSENFGLLILGVVCNLGLLYIFIFLGNPVF